MRDSHAEPLVEAGVSVFGYLMRADDNRRLDKFHLVAIHMEVKRHKQILVGR